MLDLMPREVVPVGVAPDLCNGPAGVNTKESRQLPGKGDSATFAFAEFGKTFSTLQQEDKKLETFACLMFQPRAGFKTWFFSHWASRPCLWY